MDINIRTKKNFATAVNRMFNEYGEDMAKLNGFADEQLSYTDFIDNFVDKETVADASLDSNANVSNKDIVTLINEMPKPHQKLIGFNKIFYEIQKKYGFKTANDWLREEWSGGFYLHDAHTTTFVPYCFAHDLDKLAREGLFFINYFNNQPPQHLNTFTDFVGEFVSYCCNRSSGATGIPSFLIYSYYFWRKDKENGYFGDDKLAERMKRQEFQRIVFKLNQPYLRGGIQSAFTNISIFDRPYFEALFGGKEFPDGSLMIDIEDEFMEYQKEFMREVSHIRTQNMMTFPVISYCLLRDENGKFVDEDFAKWCCRHNMAWGDANFYISKDVTSLSNCCRLVSNIKNLGYMNSIGGTALEVGSVKVNTINLARIAYESKSQKQYLDILKDKVLLCCQTLDCIRTIIQRNIEKGLLPNFTSGCISLEHMYNTIGIIGIYEVLEEFGYVTEDEFGYTFYTEEGIKFAEDILRVITEVKDTFQADKDYQMNIEQIPGERAASILMEKDKFLYPDKKYALPLYGNQWIPLGVKCTLAEKIRVSAILDKACSAGSIAHINVEKPFENFDMAWELLNKIADAGVTYFAFNYKISACKNNHGFFGETCPICGNPKVTSYARVVGFLTPERSYSSARKEEFKLRDWFTLEHMSEM